MALTFVERPGANIRNVHLNTMEWKVVSYINPKNSIRQIARANKMSDIEIRKIVYALLEAGLVEVIRPEGMPLPSGAQSFRPVDEKQRATLVNRLIDRIRSL
jgi:DNA-binding transcriptional regulator YhcF (GntR family)